MHLISSFLEYNLYIIAHASISADYIEEIFVITIAQRTTIIWNKRLKFYLYNVS